jgi:hypothetical protein
VKHEQSICHFGEVFLEAIRQALREEISAVRNGHKENGLLTPEELAGKLKIPISWITSKAVKTGCQADHRSALGIIAQGSSTDRPLGIQPSNVAPQQKHLDNFCPVK